MCKRIFLFISLFVFCALSLFCTEPLQINVICYRNGVGLNKDIDVLMEELSKLGHIVRFVNVRDHTPRDKASVNVFVDVYDQFFFSYADKNYLIPNPEWCFFSKEVIASFDKILCKTKEAVRIFEPLNSHAEFMSFTCRDCFDPETKKNWKEPLHVAGASIQKGTETVVRTWMDNPQFPSLLLIRHKGKANYPLTESLHVMYEYVTDSDLNAIQNRCGLHICPSETEGFGHYLFEAFSCANVVVTTDAPPMNEFISDPRCLASFNKQAPWRLAISYFIDPKSLDRTVSSLLLLPEKELEEIGKRNRAYYLENDRFFKKRLSEIFSLDS